MPKKLTQEEAKSKNPKNGPYLIGKYTNTRIKTEFQCACGKIFLAKPNSIWSGAYISCGHCNDPKIGDKFGRLTIMKIIPSIRYGSWVECCCDCDKINKKWKGRISQLKNGNTKSCGCLQKIITKVTRYKQSIIRWKGTKDISKTYFSRLKQGAKHRKKEFNITIEYLQELLEKQEYKCALTGLSIRCTRNVNKHSDSYEEQTASIDRIDNTKGYIIDNIQWIHKDINNMKQALKEEIFIKYCNLVTKHKGEIL